jgi:hypothetical protein
MNCTNKRQAKEQKICSLDTAADRRVSSYVADPNGYLLTLTLPMLRTRYLAQEHSYVRICVIGLLENICEINVSSLNS